MPASVGKKVKKKNTTYSAGRFNAYPAGEFFTFYLKKLPRFHQLLAVYIITLKRVIWFPRGEATAALPLISWTPSAPLWQRLPILTGKQGNLLEEVLETKLSDGTGLDWKKNGRDKLPPPTHMYIYISSFCAVILTNFPKSRHLKHFKTRFSFEGNTKYLIKQELLANLTINGGKLQQSPAKHIFPLHIERASCSKFCCRGGHCTQWMLARYHLLPHTLLQWVSRMCFSPSLLHHLNTSGIWRVHAVAVEKVGRRGNCML